MRKRPPGFMPNCIATTPRRSMPSPTPAVYPVEDPDGNRLTPEYGFSTLQRPPEDSGARDARNGTRRASSGPWMWFWTTIWLTWPSPVTVQIVGALSGLGRWSEQLVVFPHSRVGQFRLPIACQVEWRAALEKLDRRRCTQHQQVGQGSGGYLTFWRSRLRRPFTGLDHIKRPCYFC